VTRARRNMILILVGGALGSYLRYVVSRWCNQQPWGEIFPYGTLVVNVAGCFIVGCAAAVILERLPPEYRDWYLLIGTGFCGGLTTFSTFEWETYRLIRDGSWWFALANVCGSVIAGFIGVLLGVVLIGLILPRNVEVP
jgi:fluoride exporter